ncbi:MAG: T9SS type A sorting domain-containing protein [Taibaiella sp.]|nr:T9SS type A sorting domain-containing protein [Taibaiella sp.]
MKRIFTLLSFIAGAQFASGQAITINAADVSLAPATFTLYDVSTGAITSPSIATAATWDYSTYSGPFTSTSYAAETDPLFTAAGSDLQTTGLRKHLNSTMVYYFTSKLDGNATGVYENGIDMYEQLYDISAVTGTMGDSLNIPAQKYVLPTPKALLSFPMSANSEWHTSSRRVTSFKLTVASAGLTNAPCEHAYVDYRKDTIVGWGKMKVHTATGASAPIDVLMDKCTEYSTDSFYIGGSPAPASLLTPFGMAQGQLTDTRYRYVFQRKGSLMYLAAFIFSDNTFTTATTLYMSTDLSTSGINNMPDQYTTVLFPNPSTGSDINLLISGGKLKADNYVVTDMLGRTVATGAPQSTQGALKMKFENKLPAGQYLLTVLGNGHTITTEQFSVMQ